VIHCRGGPAGADPVSRMEGRINHILGAAKVCLLVILGIELRRGGGQRPK
jgi:hypothetical protein